MLLDMDKAELGIVTRGEYLQLQFIASNVYPFIEVYIVPREYYELPKIDRKEEYVYMSSSDHDMFYNSNKLWRFSIDSSIFGIHDYRYIFTGITTDGIREELKRFIVSMRNGTN